MVAGQDVETQRKGMILVGCNVGPSRRVDRQVPWHVDRTRCGLPVKTAVIHYAYDDIRMIPMMTICMLGMGASSRVRFRPLYGSIADINHKLTTYGIPNHSLPVTAEGEPKIKAHKAWVKSRMQLESNGIIGNGNDTKIVVVPGRGDVLLGRGKPFQEHFGNLGFHMLLDHYLHDYENAMKFQKMQLAQKVVDLVHEYGGRFLKQEGAGWVEVDEAVAREKVSHAFRTRRSSRSSTSLSSSASLSDTLSTKAKRPNPSAIPEDEQMPTSDLED